MKRGAFLLYGFGSSSKAHALVKAQLHRCLLDMYRVQAGCVPGVPQVTGCQSCAVLANGRGHSLQGEPF